jgi:hypothetical protein
LTMKSPLAFKSGVYSASTLPIPPKTRSAPQELQPVGKTPAMGMRVMTEIVTKVCVALQNYKLTLRTISRGMPETTQITR